MRLANFLAIALTGIVAAGCATENDTLVTSELTASSCEGDQLPIGTYQWEHSGVSKHKGTLITMRRLGDDQFTYRMPGFHGLKPRLSGCEIIVSGELGDYRIFGIQLQRGPDEEVTGFTATARMMRARKDPPHPIRASLVTTAASSRVPSAAIETVSSTVTTVQPGTYSWPYRGKTATLSVDASGGGSYRWGDYSTSDVDIDGSTIEIGSSLEIRSVTASTTGFAGQAYWQGKPSNLVTATRS